jgi:hypothetical protein
MPKDDRESPPLKELPGPRPDERRDAQTVRRYYDRETGSIESCAEARARYRELGLRVPDPELEMDYYDDDG